MQVLFSRAKAVALSCVLSAAAATASAHDVYLLAGTSTTNSSALVANLQAAGHIVTLGPEYWVFDGTQSLAGYEVVILTENSSWGNQMPTSGQQALLDFVSAGGGLMTSEWVVWSTGNGRYPVLSTCLPVTYNGYNGASSTTFAQVTADTVLNAGLPASFSFLLDDAGGTEGAQLAKPGATVFYDTTNLNDGLVGWNYGSGRVLCFSPIAGPASLADVNFGRLFQNAVNWAGTCNGGAGNFVASCEARTSFLPGASGDGCSIELFNGIGGGGAPTPAFLAGRTPSGTTLSPFIDFPRPGSVINVGSSFNSFFANTCTPPAQVSGLSAANFILRISFLLRITQDLDRTPGGNIDIQLGVGSDDGFHVTVGNTFLGQTGDRGFSYSWADVPFEAPGLYPVTLLFSANATGQSGLEFSWNTALRGTEIIPQSVMYLDDSQCTQQIRFDELAAGAAVTDQYRSAGGIFTSLTGNAAVTNAFPSNFVPVSAPYVLASPTASPSSVELRFVVPGSTIEGATDYFSCFVIDGQIAGAASLTAYAPDGSTVFSDNSFTAGAGTQERIEFFGPVARIVFNLGSASDATAIDNICFSTPYSIASPDLVVSSIAVPSANREPGESISVSWTTANNGSLIAPGPFTDRVFLSADATIGGDIFLGEVTRGALAPGASESVNQSFVIPVGTAAGTYRIVVATDAANSVNELAREGNNSAIDDGTFPIILPNSRVLFVSINGSYNPDGVNFYNTVVTAGATGTYVNLSSNGQVAALLSVNTYEQIWVYDLSTAADNYPADYDAIAAWYAARPGSTIICDGRIISSYWSGRWQNEGTRLSRNYFENIRTRGTGLVLTTDHDSFHNLGVNQINSRIGIGPFIGNFSLATIPVDVGHPLMSTPNNMGASLFDDSSPGQTPYGLQSNGRILYTVAWHSNNRDTPGISATIQGTVGYAVHITQPGNGTIHNRGAAIQFAATGENGDPPYTFQWSSNRDGALGNGSPLTISNLSTGVHTITVLSSDAASRDDDDQITITINPVADLRASALSAPSSATFGDTINVSWSAVNDGDATINNSWNDRVYLSTDTIIDGSDTLLLTRGASGPLAPGAMYSQNAAVMLPFNTSAGGPHFILVRIDDGGLVPEFSENNNSRSSPITMSPTMAPDVRITGFTGPANARFADQIPVSFNVENHGNAPANANWLDGVYLSSDMTLGGDTQILSRASTSPLAINGSYTRAVQVVLPANYTTSGQFYLIARADDSGSLQEVNETDNISVIPIQLEPTLAADLTVESVLAPSEAPDGQPAAISWTVRNIGGTGANSQWFDRVYLSTDQALDGSDTLIGQFNRPQTLGGGGVYTRAENVPIAAGLNGQRYFIVQTDAGGTQAEPGTGAENNNVRASTTPTSIVQSDLPDMVTAGLSTSENRYTGQAITVSWRTRNSGVGTANGSWVDRVHLSDDDFFDPLFDPIVGQATTSTVMPPLGEVLRSVSFNLPGTPGLYRYFVDADAGGAVNESNETNNASMILVEVVAPDYVASVEANLSEGLVGTPVTFFGSATRPVTGEPVPGKDVDIFLSLRGTERVFRVTTNDQGDFGYIFFPIPGEAGLYSVGARHPAATGGVPQDQFTIYGMRFSQNGLAISGRAGQAIMGQVDLQNLGDAPLTGITYSTSGVPANMIVNVQGPTALGPLASAVVRYTITSTNESILSSQPIINFSSTQGATAGLHLFNTVIPLSAELRAEPTSLTAAMVRGQRSYVEFDITNVGGIATQDLEVFAPSTPWLRLSSPVGMPPIPPGGRATVTFELNPAADLPLGPYGGAINVGGVGAGVSVPFNFTCISLARGGLEVYATDEFTYFGEGAPRVADAEVTVRNAIDSSLIGAGFTDGTGSFIIPDLAEGYYIIDVRAAQHGTFRSTTLVRAGPLTSIEAFLPRQTVSYTWQVVPTYTEDRYEITIDAVFETNVPAPVVTITPSSVDLRQFTDENTQVNFTITNHGLIAAQDVRLNVSEHPRWDINPLIQTIGSLPAMTSVVVPCTIRDLEFGAPGGLRGSSSCLGIRFDVIHTVICQVARDYTVPVVFIQNSAACGGPGGGGWVPYCDYCGVGPGGPGGPGGGSCTLCSIPGIDLPNIETTANCNPCVTDCALAILECAASFNPYFNCPYGLSRNCAPDAFGSIGGAIKCIGDGLILSCIPIPLTNEYQCICNIGKACTCCPGAPFPPCGFGDIVNWFSPSGGGGGGGGGGFCGGGLRGGDGGDPTDPIVNRLYEQFGRIGMVGAYLSYPFGDVAFISYAPDDGESAQTWLDAFNDAADMNSAGGEHITPTERASLISVGYPAPVTEEQLNAFLDRWNRTQDYNGLGYINRGDLPAGMDPDFIAMDEYQATFEQAIQAIEQNEAEGFDSFEESLIDSLDVLQDDRTSDDSGVCARVRIQINQQAVITRAAFRASLEIENSGTTESLTDIGVDIIIQDETGAVVNDRFGIYPPELTDLNAVDGSGTLGPETTGRASWLIVPGDLAAPTTTTTYFVSGTFSYTLGGQPLTIPLFPSAIQVVPNASLDLKYFLEKVVFSDDPFTPEVEPTVPFSLGLLMTNRGYGSAYNVNITSAQPEITENERGLLIDFAIIGTQVGFQNISPSLTVNLGDLLPGASAVARWLMTCSLQGEFVEYNATFRHVNGLGREDLSLIDNLEIHEMIHVVRALSPADDLLPDFLSNDDVDTEDLPDTVHKSDGTVSDVVPITDGMYDGAANSGDTQVQLTIQPEAGFFYVRLDDPSFGDLPLVRVRRSDGRELLGGFNFWQTKRTIHREHEPDEDEILIHIFDNGGSGSYTLFFTDGSNPCPAGAGDTTDSDGDGTPNCIDACPNDPNKTSPGTCGCNTADADTDGDGTPNCNDGCPNDPAKTAPGNCGCNTVDVDSDGDGTPDCDDGCPANPHKTAPGVCGCDDFDADSDNDGVQDCLDGCPNDSLKTSPGYCGCNVSEVDSDGDTISDCVDNCPIIPNIGQLDFDNDGVGNACDCPCNIDGNAILDSQDYFAFVEGFLAGNADINGYDGTDSQDFFDFVDCFANGCR